MAPRRIALVLKGYPRLSETFIAREILSLERAGFDLTIVSLRHPTDSHRHPVHDEISAPVLYLPEYLHQEPLRVWRAWTQARRLPGYREARRLWLKDWRRDPTPNRGRRFGQALVLAAEMPAGTDWLYAHFLHTPCSVARYASVMTAMPFSISAHAKDIYTIPDWEIAEKLRSTQWLVTCTANNVAHLRGLAGDEQTAAKVHLVHHGTDLGRLSTVAPDAGPDQAEQAGRDGRDGRDGSDPARPVRLAAVGRAVPKKGFDTLLNALALLPEGLAWRFDHIGGGALLPELRAQAARLGLDDRVHWHGARPHEKVVELFHEADLAILPSRELADGDRDGIPNVLVEAMALGVACVATTAGSIVELIETGKRGLLVPPDDADALKKALERLLQDPPLRSELGTAGQAFVRSRFDHADCIKPLLTLFGKDNAPGFERGAGSLSQAVQPVQESEPCG